MLAHNDTVVDEVVHEAIGKLLAYSLVRKVSHADHFSVHPLIHRWVRERLEWNDRKKLCKEAIILIHRTYYSTTDNVHTYSLQSHLAAVENNAHAYLFSSSTQALSVDDQLPPQPPDSIPLRPMEHAKCYFLWFYGHMDEFLRYIRGIWVGDTVSSLDATQLLYQLGLIYRDFRNYAAAENLYRWTLTEIWQHYPRCHPRALFIAGDLSAQLLWQGKLDDAQLWYEWTLKARECVLGKSHPATMGAVIGLGAIMKDRGQYDRALELLLHAYEERKRILGPNDVLTLNAMILVADTLFENEDPKAVEWYSEQLKIQSLSASPDQIARLAALGIGRGLTEEAMRLAKQLDGRSDQWSCRFQQLNVSIIDRSTTSQGYSTVIAGYHRYFTLYPHCLQFSPDGHISSALRLANLYLDTAQLDLAIDLALEISRFPVYVSPYASNKILKVLDNAITTYGSSFRIEQALAKLWEDNQNQDRDSFLTGLINLKARWLRKNGQLEEALDHYTILHTRIMDTSKRPERDEAMGLGRISSVLWLLHRYEEALEHMKHVLQLSKYLDDDVDIVMDTMNIALAYWRLEDRAESFNWCQTAFAVLVHAMNSEDSKYAQSDTFLYKNAQLFVNMFLEHDMLWEAWTLYIIQEQGDRKWASCCPNLHSFYVSVTWLTFRDLLDHPITPFREPVTMFWWVDEFH